jgi:molecular chaperone DnaK
VESAIADLKAAIDKNDVASMKRGMESLNAAQHKIAEAMYKAAQASGGAGPTGPEGPGASASGGAKSSDDVIDAEVVEEDKR